MLIRKLIGNILQVLVAVLCFIPNKSLAQTADTTINIPLGGNAWVGHLAQARIMEEGLMNWWAVRDTVSVYVRIESASQLNVSLKLQVPDGESKIAVRYLNQTLSKTIQANSTFTAIDFGKINVKDIGYLKFEIIGLAKTSYLFANISALILTGPALGKAAYVHDNHGNYFYWGRRGPSVHLTYAMPKEPVEWFYNEVTVPEGKDIMGSYFMADGFSGGYFGMQVNSPTERRLLFSVWSPVVTNDPKSIPDNLKVQLLKKGETVHAGEFGGEGSGGQSYAIYPWVAGKTYCFLIHAQGDIAAETTIYTAYFKPKDAAEWQLIASFKRPQSGNYLTGLHSFVENFYPDYGNETRMALFNNQWTRDIDGNWSAVNRVMFTGDETAKINYRKDYAGKTGDHGLYLINGGFFNDFTQLNSKFDLKADASAKPPAINFEKLP